MPGLDTDQIMNVALAQAGLAEVPADSAVLVPGVGLRKALFGVDIDVADLLFARQEGFDVVVAHHPVGGEPAGPPFTGVMWRMVDMLTAEGVAGPTARSAVAARVGPVHRRRHVANQGRVVDTARIMGLPLLNIHLPPDIVTRRFFEARVAGAGPDASAGRVVEGLAAVPEMRGSTVQPELWLGDAANPVGRAVVAIASGTNGGYPVFRALYAAGVTTILAMHIDEADFLRLEAEAEPDWNLVVTGHMPSDSIGINRLIWGLEDLGLECMRCSGIIPVPR